MAIRYDRAHILNPRPGGAVEYHADGLIVSDEDSGQILWVGDVVHLPPSFAAPPPACHGIVLFPPFLDIHMHLPQHPIRGCFTEGVAGNPAGGRLLAGLQRNVFPAEARWADTEYAAATVAAYRDDALAHGVVGGAAYATIHAAACDASLSLLSELWSVGLVLMDFNCPEYLRTDTATLEQDIAVLAERYGRRLIVTDRFAVSVTTPLRRRAVKAAQRNGLRMQTHLNEQRSEKALIEKVLYPEYASYTDVYRRDGLLGCLPIMAHCVQMTPPEWQMLSDSGAAVAHCPTSNTLLGSGVMPLDELPPSVPYALCTDIGASPTCSLLAEMAQFLKVHSGRSTRATPEEALYRATLAPAQILGVADRVGRFAPGMPLSYVEVALPPNAPAPRTASEAILAVLAMRTPDAAVMAAIARLQESGLPFGPQLDLLTADVHDTTRRLDDKVTRVVLDGRTRYNQSILYR